MKRLNLSVLALFLCGLATAVADNTISNAQTRLKEGGFYFGEITGDYGSETAAAVTRYQIRNGLQISGQLDAATTKALGLTTTTATTAAASKPAPAPTSAPQQPPESETWRRLRKTDREFLENRPPAVATSPGPATSGYESTLVLSPERLRDYVGAFVLAGLDREIGAELEFFADRVNYYNEGSVGREKIQRDLQSYAQKWPDRRFWLAGDVEVKPQADSRVSVTFPLRYNLRNGAKRSTGKVIKTLLLEVTAEDLQIVAVNERKSR